ncbi:MAG: hypothetical protein DRR08_19315 [Candidatus Parabeggiatoa sp. nov. 2]|nr:MAG: hypothetical protein B6247_12385 [Beggiatoa sp. 4572_84]RKZ57322.1 MAG: hypothetical protein DRR08_19315 [Gammaproteobacteria bacterium]
MLRIKLMTGTLLEGESYEDIFNRLQEGFFDDGEDLRTFVKNYIDMLQRMFGKENLVIDEDEFSYELVAEKLIHVGLFEKQPA